MQMHNNWPKLKFCVVTNLDNFNMLVEIIPDLSKYLNTINWKYFYFQGYMKNLNIPMAFTSNNG